jgi:2-phosphoglycerate kinase
MPSVSDIDSAVQEILAEIKRRKILLDRPVVVALDGGSGAGKSTIAEELNRLPDIAVVPVDDFIRPLSPNLNGRATRWRSG